MSEGSYQFIEKQVQFGDVILSRPVTLAIERKREAIVAEIYPGECPVHDNRFVLGTPINRAVGKTMEDINRLVPIAIRYAYDDKVKELEKVSKRMQEIAAFLPLSALCEEPNGPLPVSK